MHLLLQYNGGKHMCLGAKACITTACCSAGYCSAGYYSAGWHSRGTATNSDEPLQNNRENDRRLDRKPCLSREKETIPHLDATLAQNHTTPFGAFSRSNTPSWIVAGRHILRHGCCVDELVHVDQDQGWRSGVCDKSNRTRPAFVR